MQMLKDVIELAQKYHTKVSHRNKLRKLSLLLADANVERRIDAKISSPSRNASSRKNTTLRFLTAINYGNYLFS